MIALNLIEVKEAMERLLIQDTFDSFSFIDGSITTFATFTFDGYLMKDFYNTSDYETLNLDQQSYATWKQMKGYCYQIIKGKNTPLSFKFVMGFSNENIKTLLSRELPNISFDSVQGLYLNFQYDKEHLTCITGTSLKTFSMDKSLEHVWDDIAMKYLKQKGLLFEKL